MSKQDKDSWCNFNPMQDDYCNAEFNRYASGPGEKIDQQMCQGKGAASRQYKKHPFLVCRFMPKDMSLKALQNLCEQYGKVISVRDSTKNDHYFVDLPTVADMEAVYRGLEHNSFGFQVQVGKNFDKNTENISAASDASTVVKPRGGEIDMESRTYRASTKQHPRVIVKEHKLVSARDYSKNPLMSQNDAQQHFLIEHDAHLLERDGNLKPNINIYQNRKYNYSLGQANIPMPANVKDFIAAKNKESEGQFLASKNVYVNSTNATPKPIKLGKCIQCSLICDVLCSRCSAYICGLECQRLSWPTHRTICNKPRDLKPDMHNIFEVPNELPPMIAHKNEQQLMSTNAMLPAIATTSNQSELPKTKSAISAAPTSQTATAAVQSELPPNGSLITITSVSKTNIVFLRSKSAQDNLNFVKTIDEVNAVGKNLPSLTTAPKCGQIVVAQFEGQFMRAMILNSDNVERIRLVYLDYGTVDRKALSELRVAPFHFITMPRYAIPVVLKGVPDCYMTDEIRKFMYSHLDCIDLQLKYDSEDIIKTKGVYSVQLIDESTQQNFNETIVALAKAELPTDSEERYYREYLKHEVFPAVKNVELIVMDNSLLMTGCISCSTQPFAIAMQKFQTELQQYAEKLDFKDGYAPSVDELCIVKYQVDQKWYRGRCLELVGDGHPTIVFFDYGNIAIVNIKNIRPYPAQFTFPIMTSDCEISGLPEQCGSELIERLEQLISVGSTIKCDEVKLFDEDKFYSLTMPDLIKQLQNEGLLN